MIDLTVAQVASIVGGELADVSAEDAAGLHITGTVEFDSRKVTSGGLFLALPGARVDGHDHAAAAVAAGAVAVLAARPVGVPAIVVPAAPTRTDGGLAGVLEHDSDGAGAAVLAALAKLAAAVAAELVAGGLTIVGITGSSGKTSTKDLLAAVLAPARRSDCATRIFQQRTRPPVDGAARHTQHRLSDPRTVSPTLGQHRRAGRDRAARHRRGAQCRHRTPRRIRFAGSHRQN